MCLKLWNVQNIKNMYQIEPCSSEILILQQKKEKRKEYDDLIGKGLIDCARTEDILKPTYSHSEEINYFTADYCFATDKMKTSFEISESISEFDNDIKGKDKYQGLSDHCPIFIEIKEI